MVEKPSPTVFPSPTWVADWQVVLGPALPDAPIRPLLGVNVLPDATQLPGHPDLVAAYRQIGVNMVRTHDYYGPLDMATIYPDQNADPNNPASLDFSASDQSFRALIEAGFQPYLRIGDSWNSGPSFPKAEPRRPTNPENWVQAAVHVVRHYTDSALWGNAAPVRYVEIWNEPNHQQFWDGTPLEFYDLFARAAVALKAEFPHLQIGGPGLAPSAMISPQGKRFTFGFLDVLEHRNIPLDFLSFHIYSNDPAEFESAAAFLRHELDSRGYNQTELHITEWNTSVQDGDRSAEAVELRTGAKGAAIMTAAWIVLQQQGVTVSTFYRGVDPALDIPTFYGLFYADGRPKQMALAFGLWAEMSRYAERLSITIPEGCPLWMLAGQNDKGEISILLTNLGDSTVLWQPVWPDNRPAAVSAVQQVDHAGLTNQTFQSAPWVIETSPYAVQWVVLRP